MFELNIGPLMWCTVLLPVVTGDLPLVDSQNFTPFSAGGDASFRVPVPGIEPDQEVTHECYQATSSTTPENKLTEDAGESEVSPNVHMLSCINELLEAATTRTLRLSEYDINAIRVRVQNVWLPCQKLMKLVGGKGGPLTPFAIAGYHHELSFSPLVSQSLIFRA
eukprot:sb/3472555/